MKKLFGLLLFSAVLTIGCGDGDDETAASGSCTISANNFIRCYSYDDASAANELKETCESTAGGSYDSGACDIDNVVGKCTYKNEDGRDAITVYGLGYSAATAQDACDALNGEWDPN